MAAEAAAPVMPEVAAAEEAAEAMARTNRANAMEAAALAEVREAQRSSPVPPPKMDALATRHPGVSERSTRTRAQWASARLDHVLLTLGVPSRAVALQWRRSRRGRAIQTRHSRCRRRGSLPHESSAHKIPHCLLCAEASVVAARRPRAQTLGRPRRNFAMLSCYRGCFHQCAHSPTGLRLRVGHTGRRNWASPSPGWREPPRRESGRTRRAHTEIREREGAVCARCAIIQERMLTDADVSALGASQACG